MSKNMEVPVAPEKSKAALPVVDAQQRSNCVEFVEFCKEQYLDARSAAIFLHALHNHKWDAERERIREAMRPEIEAIFAPIKKSLAEGKDCQVLMKAIVNAVRNNQ